MTIKSAVLLQRKIWTATRSVSASLPGTDKAKKLFREMMQQAQIEFGFEADNIPLMIEAIPVNGESVILIVTKVEDPEELDTRFSKFSPYKKTKQDTLHFDGADNIIDIFQKLYEETQKAASQGASSSNKEVKVWSFQYFKYEILNLFQYPESFSETLIRLYTFPLDDVICRTWTGWIL